MSHAPSHPPTLLEIRQRAIGPALRQMVPRVILISAILAVMATAPLVWAFQLAVTRVWAGVFFFSTVFLVAFSFSPVVSRHMFRICQEEHLLDLLDQMIFDKAGPGLQAVFDGKEPSAGDALSPDIGFSLIKRILLLKGELKKETRLQEYLVKPQIVDPEDLPGERALLGSLYIGIGRYAEGMELLRERFAALQVEQPLNQRQWVGAHVQLVYATIVLHQTGEAERLLGDFRKLLEELGRAGIEELTKTCQGTSAGNVDRERLLAAGIGIDLANFWYLSGEFKALTGHPQADEDLKKAEALMADEDNQEILTLFYPTIKLARANLWLRHQDFARVESLTEEALVYYREKTRYRGPDYFMARGIKAFAQMKQKPDGTFTPDMKEALLCMQTQLEATHLDLATCLTRLAESHVRDGDVVQARNALEEALSIRSRHLPADDSCIREVRERLEALPALG